jgi:hypothetical protein
MSYEEKLRERWKKHVSNDTDWLIDYLNIPEGSKKDEEKREVKRCWHDWKIYRGFSEDYLYCEICDEKKPIPEGF